MGRKKKKEFHNIFSFEASEDKEELIHNIITSISQNMSKYEYNSFYLGISGIEDEEEKISTRSIIIDKISEKFSKKPEFSSPDVHFFLDLKKNNILVYILQVFISGKYNKLLRNIAQTEHFCRVCNGRGCEECDDTGHTTKMSVEELLAGVLKEEFDSEQLIFHGSGREDVDVLMLGEGREFVVELTIPKKRNLDLKKLEEKINKKYEGKIKVNNLEYCDKNKIKEIKNTMHEKTYLAVVECENEIKEENIKELLGKEIEVEQLTPTRVSKRRVLKVRDKIVWLKNFEKLSNKKFKIDLRTTHGTYVKEFISGDDEKTNPSLSSLIKNNCKCTQLDVIEII
jgi:tRNA pseudouridine synthase 10